MTAAPLAERIHSIRTYTKPYVSWVHIKIWKFSIHISPPGPISGVSQHLILLTLFFVPPHQLSVVLVSEKALQTWYYWEIPHHLCRNFFLNRLPIDITRIILPDLIPFRVIDRTSIQFLVFITIEN